MPDDPCVLLLGDLMLDISCDAEDLLVDEEVEGELAIAPGGQAFVAAAWLAHEGCTPTVMGAVSTRPSGALFLTLASDYGVGVVPTRYDAEQGMVLLIRHSDGRASKIAHAGVTRLLDERALNGVQVPDADAIYISGYALGRAKSRRTALRLCSLAKQYGVPLFLDLGSRLVSKDLTTESWQALLRLATPTVVFATASEAKAIMQGAQQLSGLAQAIVIKQGKHGIVVMSGAERFEHPAVPVEVVDASGCGDAFAGGFIASWLRGSSTSESAAAGLASAARCAELRGALPHLGPPTAVGS